LEAPWGIIEQNRRCVSTERTSWGDEALNEEDLASVSTGSWMPAMAQIAIVALRRRAARKRVNEQMEIMDQECLNI